MDEYFEGIFDAISDGVYIQNLEGKFIAVNSSVAKTYGYEKDYFLGKTPADFSVPGMNDIEHLRSLFHKCVVENAPQQIEFWARCADGSIFPKEVIMNLGVFRGEKVIISIAREISERKQLEEELRQYAEEDYLTELYNRRLFDELSKKAIASCKRNETPISLLIFDIDHFKTVNDTYGHQAGDLILRLLANYAKKSVRESDILARVGGEEFAILQPGSSLDNSVKWADRFRKEIAELSVHHEAGNLSVTISIGVSHIDADVNTVKDLFKRSDEALFTAKQDGRNCVRHIR